MNRKPYTTEQANQMIRGIIRRNDYAYAVFDIFGCCISVSATAPTSYAATVIRYDANGNQKRLG